MPGGLTGARLEYHRSDPKLVWSFGRERFVLEIGGETVPHKLIEKLTGKREAASHISGTWKVDEETGHLVLATDSADGWPVRPTARLPISPAGRVRVDLGDYQYNVFPGEAELPEFRRKLAFRQDGET